MPIDLDKPINSKLDIAENDVAPVSDLEMNDLPFSDITSNDEPKDEKPSFLKPLKRGVNLKKRVKHSQMPAVRAEKITEQPAETPAKVNLGKRRKATQMPAVRAEEITEQSAETPAKVNLGKRRKATQMPAVRSDGLQEPVIPWKSAPADPSNAIPPQKLNCGKGMINLAFSDKQTAIRLTVAAIITLFLTWLFYRFMIFLDPDEFFELIFVVIVFAVIVFNIGFRIVRSGEHWYYEATGREIIFSRKGRASYIIFYKDVMSVSYVPYKFLSLFNSGYTVTIIANGERIEFNYVFPNPERKLDFEDTPFEIIVNRINQLGLDETD